MKYAPLVISLACLAGGIACLALGHESIGTALLTGFLTQFVPGAHTTLRKAEPDASE